MASTMASMKIRLPRVRQAERDNSAYFDAVLASILTT
jgi:hypothetical protein